MNTKIYPIIFLICAATGSSLAQGSFILTEVPVNIRSSFRAVSVIDDSVVWVGGSNGWIGRSFNGGKSWDFKQVRGFETLDFRSLYAFDSLRAIVANAGSPAFILRTSDGGQTWQQVYENNNASAFIDGIDFWNETDGLIYGDPISGRMLVLSTTDSGKTWNDLSDEAPRLDEGEASFAASGTGIRCTGKKSVMIATGGKTSRLWASSSKGKSWRAITTPIVQGEPSTGIYSFAFLDKKVGIIVGGDYARDTLKTNHAFFTLDGGKSWKTPFRATRGYRECVEFLDDNTVVAVGPKGIDISMNLGLDWVPFSDVTDYHVIRKSRQGNLIILAGGKGKIAFLRRR